MITGVYALLFLLALLEGTDSKTFQRLQPGMRMGNGDELVSVLGLYKLVMSDADCSLNFYKFNTTTSLYASLNQKITLNQSGSITPCSYIQVLDRSIVTNASTIFLQLATSNLSRLYLIIDDTAIVRFIGIKNPSNTPNDYQQITINNYSQPNSLVSILESHKQISDRLATVTNAKNWIFQVSGLLLTITNTASQFSQSFTLPKAFFDINGVFDANNQTFPGAVFEGFRFGVICGGEKSSLLGPFVLQINNYWPTITIYDQQRYKVFQFSALQNALSANASPCPEYTFFLNDQCYAECPPPYFHQLHSSSGSCLLNCESASIIDVNSRICQCPNRVKYVRASYNCINGSVSYPFGCYCQNGTFFDELSHSCLTNCSNNMVAYLGLCMRCGRGCAQCSISFNGLYYLTCAKCSSGFTLTNGVCVYASSCTANCLTCNSSVCTLCEPFYVLSNGACISSCVSGSAVVMADLTSTCSVHPQTNRCGVDCLKCASDSSCIVCQPSYALLVSPISITCRKRNLFYTCQSQIYSSSQSSHVCYSNESSSISKLTTCVGTITNCQICHPNLPNVCILCNAGLFLQQNTCVKGCSSTYYAVNQACLPSVSHCQLTSFIPRKHKQVITQQTLANNPFYSNFIVNGTQASNEPFGFQLYFMNLFLLKGDGGLTADGEIEGLDKMCSECERGYGLTDDRKNCVPCPQGCLLCLFASTCIATTNDQVLALTLGTGLASCQSFVSQDYACIQSCPANTFPIMNATLGKVVCTSESSSQGFGYLRVDGSTYILSEDHYIHRFIFDSPISVSKGRLLEGEALSIDANGNSITFTSSSATQILNLTGSISTITAASGKYPANSVYGINYDTSFRSYIKKWLAGIGYVLSIFLILLHCIYIANGILYKMDNIIIFAQSLFFFLFNQILIANPVAQYYYGWSWTHLNFFPNYFSPQLDLSQPTIPPYALYNLDGNLIRNVGSTLSFLLTFLMAWGVVSLAVYVLQTYYGRKEIWYEKISKNAGIAVIQFFSYNIFYWCMAFINYDKSYSNSGTFIGLAVLLLTVLIIYTIGRCYLNYIGGLYMVKRLLFACVLASSYERVGYVGVIILLEVCFGVGRSLIQRPRQKWLLVGLWIQEGILIIFWIILYTTVNASVISILTTIFVYGWMLTFVADLSDLYFQSRNRYLQVSCFKKLFEEQEGEACRSNESADKNEGNKDTDRPFNSNANHDQKH